MGGDPMTAEGPQGVRSNHDESVRHVIAGMLSTIGFTPSQTHPDNMLPMSDLVIHAIQQMSQKRDMTLRATDEHGIPIP